jgi:hypothetical protein
MAAKKKITLIYSTIVRIAGLKTIIAIEVATVLDHDDSSSGLLVFCRSS